VIKLAALRGMTLVAALLLYALPDAAAGQEPSNPSTADLADKIQSLRNQLDILREDVERRLGQIEALTDRQTNARRREQANGSSSASDNAHQILNCDVRTTDSLARYYDRHSDACRHTYYPALCCWHVYRRQPCHGSIRDLKQWLSELD
jgi:hypothetical protein